MKALFVVSLLLVSLLCDACLNDCICDNMGDGYWTATCETVPLDVLDPTTDVTMLRLLNCPVNDFLLPDRIQLKVRAKSVFFCT